MLLSLALSTVVPASSVRGAEREGDTNVRVLEVTSRVNSKAKGSKQDKVPARRVWVVEASLAKEAMIFATASRDTVSQSPDYWLSTEY